MKIKKMVLVLAIVLGIGCFLTTNASAAAAWYTCSINYIGAASGASLVNLTDTAGTPAFTAKWFKLTDTVQDRQLATALTASSLGWNVLIYVDAAAAGNPTIINFYLKQQ